MVRETRILINGENASFLHADKYMIFRPGEAVHVEGINGKDFYPDKM